MTRSLLADPSAGEAAQIGGSAGVLTEDQIRTFVDEQLAGVDLQGRSRVMGGGTRCPCRLRSAGARGRVV